MSRDGGDSSFIINDIQFSWHEIWKNEDLSYLKIIMDHLIITTVFSINIFEINVSILLGDSFNFKN